MFKELAKGQGEKEETEGGRKKKGRLLIFPKGEGRDRKSSRLSISGREGRSREKLTKSLLLLKGGQDNSWKRATLKLVGCSVIIAPPP